MCGLLDELLDMVAASITCDCSLYYLWLQPLVSMDAGLLRSSERKSKTYLVTTETRATDAQVARQP